MQHISIVIPVWNEEGNLPALVDALDTATKDLNQFRWSYLFVNDGSTDRSLAVLKDLAQRNERCTAIDLSRNYGKELALSAGLLYATGDAVICMDADLQHPPSFIPQLVKAWQEGAEIVATVRKTIEKQPILRVWGSLLFYYLMSKFSELDMTSQTTDFRLIDRKVVDEFNKIKEKKRMFRGLIDWLGYRKVWLEFNAPERVSGESTFSYRGLWNLAFDSFISYSSFPLRLVGYLGLFITGGSAATLLWMVVAQAMVPERFNFTPLAIVVVANTLLIGVVLMALGLVSLYINKIYAEIIERPLFSVREHINLN